MRAPPERAMPTAYLSLGSNLDPVRFLREGIAALRARFDDVAVSAAYRFPAVGYDGPDFINAAAAIRTELSPEALNAWLHALEDAHGRDRSGPRYSDRTLDIDIVLYDDLVAEGVGNLRIPRDELRHAFVLKPLAQIAPGAVHPLERRTIAELWQAHPDHDVAFDEVAYRKFKRPFRAVCWVGGGRASPVLGTDRTSVSGISASRGHAAALSAAMLR